MKKLITLFFFLFAAQNIFAQSGWQWINPSIPGSGEFYGIQFVDQNTGWLFGRRILMTTDGGIHWNYKTNQINAWTTHFLNSHTGYYANGSTINKTTDGGNNWVQNFYNGVGGDYTDIFFYNESIGVAIKSLGGIYTTTNAGVNWLTQTGSNQMRAVRFFNSSTGYIFTSLTNFYKTTNSGINWFTVPAPSPVYKAEFLNSTTGFAVGTQILKTTDAGITWVSKGSSSGPSVKDVFFLNNTKGYIISNDGGVRFTSDGGESWNSQTLSSGNYSGISYINGTTGFITLSTGSVLKTTNDGANWINANNAFTTTTIKRVQTLGANNTWLSAGEIGKLYHSTNGGYSWDTITTGMQGIPNWFQFINSNTGWICDDITNFKKTTDGGATWTFCSIIGTLDVTNFTFINENTGWACGTQTGKIFKTTNGGNNWISEFSQSNTYPSCVFFLNQQTGWRIAGSYSYKTTNAGVTWVTGGTPYYQKLFFINENTGWSTGGYAAAISKTTNGGLNWTSYYQGFGTYLQDLQFINPQTGWAGGSHGLYKSTDGGVSWVLHSPYIDSLFSVSFSDANFGWAAGTNGSLLKTTTGGIVPVSLISSEIPDNFSLSQNYPNPFNPTTKINYEIKSSSFVSLKVFDLLGKEVASLVNEKQNAGSYSIDFNSTELNLPSGIYFYTLSAGEFIETRKMVLLK